MSALHGLQDKIRNLELERSLAEDNLKSLATETTRYKDILQNSQENSYQQPRQTNVSRNTQGDYCMECVYEYLLHVVVILYKCVFLLLK